MAIRLEDTILLARELEKQGVDVIDCSSSGNEGPLTLAVVPRVPGYHVPFAERIRHEADMPTVEAGLITDPRQAEGYLSEGRCDLIALRANVEPELVGSRYRDAWRYRSVAFAAAAQVAHLLPAP